MTFNVMIIGACPSHFQLVLAPPVTMIDITFILILHSSLLVIKSQMLKLRGQIGPIGLKRLGRKNLPGISHGAVMR